MLIVNDRVRGGTGLDKIQAKLAQVNVCLLVFALRWECNMGVCDLTYCVCLDGWCRREADKTQTKPS